MHCGRDVKNFFVFIIDDDGASKVYIDGGVTLSDDVARQFFDEAAYNRIMDRDGEADVTRRCEGEGDANK